MTTDFDLMAAFPIPEKIVYPPKLHRKAQDINWDAVDWSYRNMDIANQLGILNSQLVSDARKLLNKPKPTRLLQRVADKIAAIDWSKKNAEIARELNMSDSHVYQWRNALKRLESSGCEQDSRTVERDWQSIDWTKQDMEIATLVGVSRERVRQVRRMLGKPNSENAHQWGDTTKRFQKRAKIIAIIKANHNRFATMLYHEIAAELGCSCFSVKRYYKLAKIKLPNAFERIRRSLSHQYNWDLPDATLKEIWQCANPGCWRQKKAKFIRTGGALRPKTAKAVAKYESLVDNEIEKAKANGKTPFRWVVNTEWKAKGAGKKSILDTGNANWSLCSKDLASIWGLTVASVQNHRTIHKKSKCKEEWKWKNNPDSQEYRDALNAEIEKANQYGA